MNDLAIHQEKHLTNWGDREEIAAISRRLRTMLPNGSKLSDNQMFALAQYALLTGLDPFTGAIHALPDGGIMDGYKVLTAWAQSKEPFVEKLFRLTEDEKAIEGLGDDCLEVWYCYVLKRGQQSSLAMFLQSGLSIVDALGFVANRGLGVVRKSELKTKQGYDRKPPETKSWAWVAQKRALRAAIAVGYGQPTLTELSALGARLEIEGLAVSDGAGISIGIANQAQQKLSTEAHATRLADNRRLMRGDSSAIGEDEPMVYQPTLVDVPPQTGVGAAYDDDGPF